jgi:hypothetical protein
MATWLPASNSEVDVRENRVSGGAYAHTLQHDAHAWGGCGRMGWRVLAILLRTAVLEGTERFEEAEGDIAMHGILADQQCYFLAEDREVESPVGKQQHRAGVAAPRQVAKQEPDCQPKAQQGLHAFDRHHSAL